MPKTSTPRRSAPRARGARSRKKKPAPRTVGARGSKPPARADLAHIEPALRALAVPIDTVKPDPQNARKHSARNMEVIRTSMSTFRQQSPITVDADGIIRKGNATHEVGVALGWKYIAAVPSTLRGVEAKAYGIADNRSGDAEVGSIFDDNVLRDIVTELQDTQNELVCAIGYEDVELERLLKNLGDVDFDGQGEATEPDGNNGTGQQAPVPPTAPIRMVQLFYTTAQHAEFESIEQTLREQYGTDNISDTVMEALRRAHGES